MKKRRRIGSKSRESASPEGKRDASMGLVGFWKHAAPGHQNNNECFCFQGFQGLQGVKASVKTFDC
eukprot:893181-Pelagomonas_calceolata.AAC.1